jgi:4-oxalomesaconate tautomerase
MLNGVRAMLMRGGTSKGLFFLRSDLPDDEGERDDLLLRLLGSPDPRQIDGLGGAHPLTSKVAVVDRSEEGGTDVDYLFLQVAVDEPVVTDRQSCGNILAGVAGFALERGLVTATGDHTEVRVRMRNTGGVAAARIPTPGGRPDYRGDMMISGAPFPSAPVELLFEGIAGSTCGSLLPTGNPIDHLAGADDRPLAVTCIDNGMPVVVLSAAELGVAGTETPAWLEANGRLRADLEAVRLAAGPLMGLGDVTDLTVPKLTIVSAPVDGGTLHTRTFIPHRCHDAIGVLGAVSAATACLQSSGPAAEVAVLPADGDPIVIEHPTGRFDCVFERSDDGGIRRAGVIRTARKLFDGEVFPRQEETP